MSYYATDAEYGYQFFDSETVPGDNTIQSGKHTFLKDKAHNKVKALLGVATSADDPTDTYGNLKEGEMFAYGIYLNNPLGAFAEGSEELLTLKGILKISNTPAVRVTKKQRTAAWREPSNFMRSD